MLRPSISPTWFTFIGVFSSEFWYVLMTVTAMCFVVLSLLYYIQLRGYTFSANNFTPQSVSESSLIRLNVSSLDQDRLPKKIAKTRISTSLKVFLFFLFIYFWLIKESYNAGLISSFVHPTYKSDINALEDLLDYPNYQLILWNGTSIVQEFEFAQEWPYKQIWETQLQSNEEAYVHSFKEAETLMIKNKKYVYFEIINQVENSLENYPCDIVRSSKTYFQRPAALGFRKNSPYLSLFNYNLGMYKQSGVLSNLASIKRHSTYTADCQGNQTLSVTYKQVFSAFLVFGIGIGISLLNAIIEFLFKVHLKKFKT